MLWRRCSNVLTTLESDVVTTSETDVGTTHFRPCHNVVTTSTTTLWQRCHSVAVPAGLKLAVKEAVTFDWPIFALLLEAGKKTRVDFTFWYCYKCFAINPARFVFAVGDNVISDYLKFLKAFKTQLYNIWCSKLVPDN